MPSAFQETDETGIIESIDRTEDIKKQWKENPREFKKEAKKELRNINDTAINQLNKEHQEKQRMIQRIN